MGPDSVKVRGKGVRGKRLGREGLNIQLPRVRSWSPHQRNS